ncbi:unnamed protein product [Ectocarpus sp. 12 AP-2014]
MSWLPISVDCVAIVGQTGPVAKASKSAKSARCPNDASCLVPSFQTEARLSSDQSEISACHQVLDSSCKCRRRPSGPQLFLHRHRVARRMAASAGYRSLVDPAVPEPVQRTPCSFRNKKQRNSPSLRR